MGIFSGFLCVLCNSRFLNDSGKVKIFTAKNAKRAECRNPADVPKGKAKTEVGQLGIQDEGLPRRPDWARIDLRVDISGA
jgi:hypothetical protein